MKRFGKAAITTLYNARTKATRKAWCEPEVQWQKEEVLHRLLKDLHPNRTCRRLLADSDMILLKHITYQMIREFNMCSREHVKCKDQEWISEEYADALEGEMRPICLADDYADSTGCADGDGLDDVVGFNAFSPNTSSRNASSPLSDSSGTIEDGDAMRDLNPIPGYYTSQDFYTLSLLPIAAAIEPNLNTPVNHYDTEFSMATPTPLTNIRTMNEDAIAMDNLISPSSWNDTQWDAFVGTETSNPTQDIDTILRECYVPKCSTFRAIT